MNKTEKEENIAYCVPYGNLDWENLMSNYSTRIVRFLSKSHVEDKFNPLAWLDYGK